MSTSKPSVQKIVREVKGSLRAMKNPQRAKDYQRYFKEPVTMLGIESKVLKAYQKSHIKPWIKTWSLNDAVVCCDALLKEPEMEIRGTGHAILGHFKKQFTADLTDHTRIWLEQYLDNWALVDGFCTNVMSPLLQHCPDVEPVLCEWSQAESLWVRRAALVTFIPFARKGQYLDRAYELTAAHFEDPEDLMHKAMGWLLREAGKTNMKRLREYLLDNGPSIPRTTLRYAIERYPTQERKMLLDKTRAKR